KPSYSNAPVSSLDQNVQKGPVRIAKDYSDYDYSRGYRGELDEPIDVLVVPAETNFTNNMLNFLTGFDEIHEITYLDGRTNTPTLETLQEYDVVITFSNFVYQNTVTLGNNIADYVDEGGALIVTVFALYPPNTGLGGRFNTDDYCPIVQSTGAFGLMVIGDNDEGHPIMTDVGDVSGYYKVNGDLSEDAEEVAAYVNNWGTCVATKEIEGNIIVAINDCVKLEMYTGDMDLILANSIIYAAGGGGEPDATMEGTITDAVTGDDMEDAIIRVGIGRDTTEANGEYFIDVVSGEDRRVRVMKEHYYSHSEDIDIEVGANFFDFEITPLATMTGVIYDSETELPVEGAVITWAEHTDTSDAEGNYMLIDLEAGIDTLEIETDGYFDLYDEEYEVEDGDAEIDFAIDILSGDLTGIVSDALTEEALFGARITVTHPDSIEPYRDVTTDEFGMYTAVALHNGVRYLVAASLEGYAPSDTETVTIRWNNDNERDIALTPIFERDLQQLQNDQDMETWVYTTGIVTQGTNVTDMEHTDFYIQDESGWGIQIYADDPWDPENNINRGDEVNVLGFLVVVDDITRITQFEIELVGTGNDLPEPLVATTGEMSGNSEREGTWARINGQINRDPPDQGTYTLVVNDGSGQCEVRIVESTGIDLTDMVQNDWGNFTGVISLSRQGLRLIPNIQEDAFRIAVDPPTDLSVEAEEIAGDTLQLQVTLAWNHDHLDEWLRFKIYRDGEHVGNTQQNSWNEFIIDPDPGEYALYEFEYGVSAIYDEGETDQAEIIVEWDVVTVTERPFSGIPTDWALEAVYPNPFNPSLHIVLAVPQVTDVSVEIIDILGRQVAELYQGEMNAAYHRLEWHATGSPTGLYFLRIDSRAGFNSISKVMYIK
ncbi:carboxypeptidase regulatory-like domain-containing protein, partial [Calditrichota bacterium]